MKTLKILVFVALLFPICNAYAQPVASGGYKAEPALLSRKKEYDSALPNLTDNQKGRLQALDQELMQASAIFIDIETMNAYVQSCPYGANETKDQRLNFFRKFKHTKEDEYISALNKVEQSKSAVAFMDKTDIDAHLRIKNEMAIHANRKKIDTLVKSGIKPDDCAEKIEQIKTANAPYEILINATPLSAEIRRDSASGFLTKCSLSGSAVVEGESPISISMSLSPPSGDEDSSLSIKTSLKDSATGKDLDVQDFWIDFNPPSSRFEPTGSLRMASNANNILPVSSLLTVLTSLGSHGPVLSVLAPGWSKRKTLAFPATDQATINNYASCVANMDPVFTKSLVSAGMTITPDKEHLAAVKKFDLKPSDDFVTSSLLSDPENPGACVWNMGTYLEPDGDLIKLTLFIAGHVDDNNPLNYTASFRIVGVNNDFKHPIRYTLDDARILTTNAEKTDALDTKVVQTKLIRGKELEIQLPLADAMTFVEGINKNGFNLNVYVKDSSKSFTGDIRPPHYQEALDYTHCIDLLRKDFERRSAVQGTAQ